MVGCETLRLASYQLSLMTYDLGKKTKSISDASGPILLLVWNRGAIFHYYGADKTLATQLCDTGSYL